MEARINSIENMLYHAEIIVQENRPSVISLGNSVTFIELPDGEEETYTIVGVTEAEPSKSKISSEFPIAKSLLGQAVGDILSIHTTNGEIKVKILHMD